MFALGVLLFAFLNVLALAAALSIALRADLKGRAEIALATGLLWNAIIAVPIYALGLTGHLDARTLACLSGPFSLALLALSSWRRPGGRLALARDLASAAKGQLRLPFEALRDAWRARSFVLLGLLMSAALIVWTGICSYYAPSWRQWDALWYHEPIVAFTIQNHGFAMVPLPVDGLQKINGYPRLCEMTQLWFVIFTDRRLIEMANSFLAPLLMLATYLLTFRPSKDRVSAMGWATVIVIMPGTSIVLQSAYVDMHTSIFVLAAAHFCIRAPLRMRDVWFAAGCLTMAIGAKILALVPVGMLTITVLIRVLWAHSRARPRATIGTIVGGLLMMLGIAATTYWRNWKHFHNPFWPDLVYDNPRLGIHWPGLAAPVSPLDMNSNPFLVFFDNLTSIPYSRALGHQTQVYEYGFVVGWLIVPLATLSMIAILLVAARSLLSRVVGQPAWRLDTDTFGVLLLIIPLVVSLYLTPALWGARYNMASMALAAVFISWATSRAGFERLAEGAVAIAVVGTIIAFFWTTPRWWYTPSELVTLAKVRYPDREVTPAAKISPGLGLASGSPIPFDVGHAREKMLGKGDTLAFDDLDGSFIAVFWNNKYSNRVVYVPSGPDFLARVDQAKATWLYCHYADPSYATVRASGSGWTEIGPANVERWGALFRRSELKP